MAKKTKYGALVSEANQEKCVDWCKERLETGYMYFNDGTFSDKCIEYSWSPTEESPSTKRTANKIHDEG